MKGLLTVLYVCAESVSEESEPSVGAVRGEMQRGPER